ncbi:NOP protein chaperone 1 [Echinops telfairi]|uniref:NOP protein chaperone 1 n=1 Tax=Echinops telfairi TaxID=9371 RepID=A0ABM0IHV7_ECHTE|nr:NOP protein chaperone 1 [Echinops telfairi]
MEVPGERQPSPTSCSSSSPGGPGVSVSKELLTAGSGGLGGIWDRLLINSKPNSRKNSRLQTVRIERSPLLDQVQSFLPQMALANEKLRKEMAAAPPGRFDIENVDEPLGKIIQMDVALFEMEQPAAKEEESWAGSAQDGVESSSDSEDGDVGVPGEVTLETLKLPNAAGGKGKIEVLDGPASKKKKE